MGLYLLVLSIFLFLQGSRLYIQWSRKRKKPPNYKKLLSQRRKREERIRNYNNSSSWTVSQEEPSRYKEPPRYQEPNEEFYVNLFINHLLHYGYQSHLIMKEFPIQIGSTQKRADIVVFYGSQRTQDNIFLIAEVKRPTTSQAKIRNAFYQLQSYVSACLNCQYGVLVIGETYTVFKIDNQQGIREFIPVSDLPTLS